MSDTTEATREADARRDEANRRVFRRIPASALPAMKARVGGGAGTEVRLIDLSRGGARFESESRLLPGSTVAIRLVTPDSTLVMHGRVVRSRVARLEHGGLGYDAAIAFEKPLKQLADEQDEPPAAPAAAEPRAPEAQQESAPVLPPAPAGAPSPAPSGAMVTVTASVSQSTDELREMFNGNEW